MSINTILFGFTGLN